MSVRAVLILTSLLARHLEGSTEGARGNKYVLPPATRITHPTGGAGG